MFKVEAQRLVIFMFAESRVALLWVYMTVMCCWISGFRSRRVRMSGALFWSGDYNAVPGGTGRTPVQ